MTRKTYTLLLYTLILRFTTVSVDMEMTPPILNQACCVCVYRHTALLSQSFCTFLPCFAGWHYCLPVNNVLCCYSS